MTAPNRGRRVSTTDRAPASPKRQATAKRGKNLTDLEADLLRDLALLGMPVSDDDGHEIRFHPTRRWRLDHGWRALRLAFELEGATFVGGRHTSGAGFEGDCRKYNAAALMGWQVLRFTRAMLASGEALDVIETAYKLREVERAA